MFPHLFFNCPPRLLGSWVRGRDSCALERSSFKKLPPAFLKSGACKCPKVLFFKKLKRQKKELKIFSGPFCAEDYDDVCFQTQALLIGGGCS